MFNRLIASVGALCFCIVFGSMPFETHEALNPGEPLTFGLVAWGGLVVCSALALLRVIWKEI